jgi:hypothetical protein
METLSGMFSSGLGSEPKKERAAASCVKLTYGDASLCGAMTNGLFTGSIDCLSPPPDNFLIIMCCFHVLSPAGRLDAL